MLAHIRSYPGITAYFGDHVPQEVGLTLPVPVEETELLVLVEETELLVLVEETLLEEELTLELELVELGW